jgi:hypothetical protein
MTTHPEHTGQDTMTGTKDFTSPDSPYYRKYPGTCDIDLPQLIALRLADGDSPVTEPYEVPDEFALAEAELADLLAERLITVPEAIDAGHPHVWVLAAGEEHDELDTSIYADRELARGDFAAAAAALLERWGAQTFDTITAEPSGALFLQLHCDLVRLDAQLITTAPYQVRPALPDSRCLDFAWAAIDTAQPAPAR